MDKNKIVERMLHTVGGLHVREKADGTQSRTITGYAILFNTPSAVLWSWDDEDEREIIEPGAVTQDLLDACDIKMTMFHDRQLILARSKQGQGTLTYKVDEKGVSFEFEAPMTAEGDKALESVRRGDIDGCSFAFRTHYYDRAFVEPTTTIDAEGKKTITYHVKTITDIRDFTLTADPAYPDTTCEASQRELFSSLRELSKPAPADTTKIDEQVRDMQERAKLNWR